MPVLQDFFLQEKQGVKGGGTCEDPSQPCSQDVAACCSGSGTVLCGWASGSIDSGNCAVSCVSSFGIVGCLVLFLEECVG